MNYLNQIILIIKQLICVCDGQVDAERFTQIHHYRVYNSSIILRTTVQRPLFGEVTSRTLYDFTDENQYISLLSK